MQTAGDQHFESAAEHGAGRILVLWHGRMVLGLPHHGHRDMAVLVSTSGDGELAKRLLTHYGYGVIRGSTSKRGCAALRELLSALKTDQDIVLTPDGPRGPRHSMNMGPAFLARETGKSIVPIGLACDRAWRLKSWDRFTIPKFRARVAIQYGDPLRIEPDSGEDELEVMTTQLRKRLIAAESSAFEQLGAEIDW